MLAGSTLARGSPLKGVTMTVLGLVFGIVGSDIETGTPRLTFGLLQLYDGVEIAALALGLFGIAEFMKSVNQNVKFDRAYANVSVRDMWPSGADLRRSFFPMIRGTMIGSLCALIPGTGPTIASFVSYATEKKISRTPEKFGTGMIEGVACPEASTHSSVQGDFIPTMSLGIPGDVVMALILGALMIQGIVPGPQLITQHPDIFWGLIASFWVGNILLVMLNVPMIGLWVKLLAVPYKYLYPSALFFICIGVYGVNNDLFQVGLTLVIGIFGYILLLLGFHPAPILLGFVLGPRFEENFRRAMLISRGDLKVFVDIMQPPDRDRVRRPVGAAARDPGRAVAAALEVRLQGADRAGRRRRRPRADHTPAPFLFRTGCPFRGDERPNSTARGAELFEKPHPLPTIDHFNWCSTDGRGLHEERKLPALFPWQTSAQVAVQATNAECLSGSQPCPQTNCF